MNGRISIKGILLGGILDVGLSMLLNTIFILFWIMQFIGAFKGAELAAKISEVIATTPAIFAATFAIGSLCSILGGYFSARIAKRHEVLNGALSSWLCIALGVYGLLFKSSSPTHGIFLAVLSIPLSFGLAALGGYLRRK
jgi:hypothetical protein